MALAPVVNRNAQAASPPAVQKNAADQFSKATQQARPGEAANTKGADGQNTGVKTDQSKVQGRGERDQDQSGQNHPGKQTRLVNGMRVTTTDGHVTGRVKVGADDTKSAAGSQNTGTNRPEMRQAAGSELPRIAGQASPIATNVVLTMPRALDSRSTRPGEMAGKATSDFGSNGTTSPLNAEAAIRGQQNGEGSSGGSGGQQGGGDNQGGDTSSGNDSGDNAGGSDQDTGGFGGGGNINRPTATGASPDEPDDEGELERSLYEHFEFNNPNFGHDIPAENWDTTLFDTEDFMFTQSNSGEPSENTPSQGQDNSGNAGAASSNDEPVLADGGEGGNTGAGGGNRTGGGGLRPDQPEDSGSGDELDESPLSLQQRRDQAIANNQGKELDSEVNKNLAIAGAKAVAAAVDMFGKVALPSLFTNKFIRSTVSQLMQRDEPPPRSELKQLADAIVGEIIDKVLLVDPRMRLLSKAGNLKDAAAEAIVDTLIGVSRNIPVPGMDQSIYEAVTGFIASRIVENAEPGQIQPDASDDEGIGNPELLRSTTVESLARNSVQVTTAIGNIGKTLLTPVGAVLNESSKAAITFGVSAIVTGLMTGNFKVLQFDVQDPNLSPEEEKLSRIINQPAKNPITAIQVDTPFVDPKYGSKTSLWFNTYASVQPWFFPPALLPGQVGQPPWVSTSDGRLRVMNFAPAGNVNYLIGITTGTRNAANTEFLAINAPRFQPQMLTDFGSTGQRKSPIDTKFSLFGAPISAIRGSEYILGQGKSVQGAIISPVTADLSVGTQGVGFKATSSGLDIIPFAGVSPNPGYDPNDLLYNDIMKLKDAIPLNFGGK
jgi:hypothetical protein